MNDSRWIILVSEDGEENVVPVPTDGVLTLGRSEDSGLRLSSEGVSRHHAVVNTNGGLLVITDAGSTNGTAVNGERIVGPRELRSGDTASLGRATLRVMKRGMSPRPTTAELPAIPAPQLPDAPSFRNTKGPLQTGSGMQNDLGNDGTVNAATGHGVVRNERKVYNNPVEYRVKHDGYFASQQHFNDNSRYTEFEFPEVTSVRRGGLWGALTVIGLIILLIGVLVIGYCILVTVTNPNDCFGKPRCATYVFPVINGVQVLPIAIAVAVAGGAMYGTGAVAGSMAAAREEELERRRNRRRGRRR